jgi:hypothetical protein
MIAAIFRMNADSHTPGASNNGFTMRATAVIRAEGDITVVTVLASVRTRWRYAPPRDGEIAHEAMADSIIRTVLTVYR